MTDTGMTRDQNPNPNPNLTLTLTLNKLDGKVGRVAMIFPDWEGARLGTFLIR